jgi:hypothetical protein
VVLLKKWQGLFCIFYSVKGIADLQYILLQVFMADVFIYQ